MLSSSKHPYEVRFAPVPLDNEFPIHSGGPYWRPKDRPITYLHVHQALELGYCHEGSGIFVVGGKVMPYMAADVSVINASEPHLARSAPGTESTWRFITLDPIRLLGPAADVNVIDPSPLAGPEFRNILTGPDATSVAPLMLRLITELDTRGAEHRSAIKAIVWLLIVELKRIAPRTPQHPAVPSSHYARIAPALAYLAGHLSESLRVVDLANRCGLSEPHFRRLFIQAIGKSPHSYWLNLRLQMACSLLRSTSLSVLEISEQAGFETLSNFNRAFRKQFHTTPREWRRNPEIANRHSSP